MSNSNKNEIIAHIDVKVPSLFQRIYSVWFRHIRVYTRHLISNGLPPFLEPLFFLLAIGVGLGFYIEDMEGLSYISFLASGILIPPAMYTAAFECSFGTFIRMEFDKVYDGMIASSITCKDLLLGEILFAATKALFFSFSILIVITIFGIGVESGSFPSYPSALLAPIGGFFTGIMFASLSMIITYFVKTINHFNFYFTGVLTPMFFFSGIVFPLSRLPQPLRIVAEFIPLTHSVRIVRAFCFNTYSFTLVYDSIYIIVFSIISTFLAITLLSKRLID